MIVQRSSPFPSATIVFIMLTMMWLMGCSIRRSAARSLGSSGRPVGNAALAAVEKIRVPVTESAVGTVRPVHEAAVASKILAKVLEVNVKAGDRVTKDEVLIRLDDGDLKARQQQAVAAVAAAKAARDQAKVEFERVDRAYRESNAAPRSSTTEQVTALKAAEAETGGGEAGVERSRDGTGYATDPVVDGRCRGGQAGRRWRHGHAGPGAAQSLRSDAGCSSWPACGSH